MYRRKKAKMNIPMCTACVLLCLTLFSVYLCGGMYARYIVTESGEDAARVITFGNLTLSEAGDFYDTNKLMLIPGVNLQKRAWVDFAGSESETYVFVEVTPSSAWSSSVDHRTFSVVMGGKTLMSMGIATEWTYLPTSGGSCVYYREVAPNDALSNAQIIANDGLVAVSDQITRTEMASLTGLSLSLRATVVQSGGFDSAAAAWASVAAKGG